MFIGAALFTVACAYAAGNIVFPSLPLPRVVRLGLGTVGLSLSIFVFLLLGWANPAVLLVFGSAVAAAAVIRVRPAPYVSAVPIPRLLWIPFAIYAAMYAVQALAPEIQPDAVTYHLGLAAEYARTHRFSQRIGFYECIPQGLEMLFTMAYELGGGSAAKLVHFAFLLATFPLMLTVGRQLNIAPAPSFAAALLYFAMPVAGITGTSTYNDAALVFFTIAVFSCLLAWEGDRRLSLLAATGLLAGFCFAIKFTGFPIVAASVLAVALLARRPLPLAVIAISAAIPSAPWLVRSFVLTGNPLAPLMNAWFPNPFFNAAAEHLMAANLRTFPGFTLHSAPWEYALHGGYQGIVGPLFFMLPLALLALRKWSGRILLLSALVALSPWFFNAGTRFLMPAVPFVALALVSALPLRVVAVMAGIQLAVCWPPILQSCEAPFAWAFREIPWRAALRIESPPVYLDRAMGDYAVARMIEERVAPGDRVFCLTPAAKAYTSRDVVQFWYSTPDEALGEALQTALLPPHKIGVSAAIPHGPIAGLRLVTGRDAPSEFRIFELKVGREMSSDWQLQASPNLGEAAGATDGNPATSWRSRAPAERGMFCALLFDKPTEIDRVDAQLQDFDGELLLQTQQKTGGPWRTVADSLRTTRLPPTDLRRDATRALRRAGFHYILARAGTKGMDRVSDDMVLHTAEWGLRDRGEYTPVHLFEIESR